MVTRLDFFSSITVEVPKELVVESNAEILIANTPAL